MQTMVAKPEEEQQYLDVVKVVWKHIDQEWKRVAPRILGKNGFHAVQLQAIRLSHPPLPIFLYLLGCCVMLGNGASVCLWGGVAPITLWILNINYSQTRKSGLNSLCEKMTFVIDKLIRRDRL